MKSSLQFCRFITAITFFLLYTYSGAFSQDSSTLDTESFSSPPSCISPNQPFDNLPILVVNVKIHFIETELGNFVPGDPDDDHWQNGTYAAIKMIEQANEYFSDMIASPTSSNPMVGDIKIRFEIFSSLEEGIFYWENEEDAQNSAQYDNEAINVFVKDHPNPNSTAEGTYQIGAKNVTLFTWHEEAFENETSAVYSSKARVFLHSLGHIAGLCNVFSIDNNCEGIDISAYQECNGNTPLNGCDPSITGTSCDPWGSGSTNLMSSVANGVSLTNCQWKIFYNFLRYEVGGIAFIDICREPVQVGDVIVEEDEEWEGVRSINGNIIIKPGRTLFINCILGMGPNSSIIIERGARLIVSHGLIANTCRGEKWEGIYVEGNANMDQPDPQMPILEPDQSGVLYLYNATIRGARNAISTSRFGAHWDSNYWGGVIYAWNTDFIDNDRSIEFLKYESPTDPSLANTSEILDCNFFQVDNTINTNYAVTIWGCNRVLFEECLFENFGKAAILGIDAGINLSRSNKFKGNHIGVQMMRTSPIQNKKVIIGEGGNPFYLYNNFENNDLGVLLSSLDGLGETKVIENIFYGELLQVNDNIGLYCVGPQTATIGRNHFLYLGSGLILLETKENKVSVICNFLRDISDYNIAVFGDNSKSRFIYNSFYTSSLNKDISIQPYLLESKGEIAFNQITKNGAPALNCFSSPKGILAPIGQTEPFNYFIAENNPKECHFTDNLGENFDIQNILYIWDQDICSSEALSSITSNISRADLLKQKRICSEYENLLYTSFQKDPNSISTKHYQSSYQQEKMKEDEILRSLLSKEINQHNWLEVESILMAEQSKQAAKWLIDVQFLQKDYEDAKRLIQTYPVMNKEDLYFKKIMEINLQRLKQPRFELSSAQELLLYEIAYSNFISVREYARGILTLLKGETFPIDIPGKEDPQVNKVDNKPVILKEEKKLIYKLYPNPSSGSFRLHFPVSEELAHQILELRDINGRLIESIRLDQSGELFFKNDQLTAGIYFVSIKNEQELFWQNKLVIIR